MLNPISMANHDSAALNAVGDRQKVSSLFIEVEPKSVSRSSRWKDSTSAMGPSLPTLLHAALVGGLILCHFLKQICNYGMRYFSHDQEYPFPQALLVTMLETIKLVIVLFMTGGNTGSFSQFVTMVPKRIRQNLPAYQADHTTWPLIQNDGICTMI